MTTRNSFLTCTQTRNTKTMQGMVTTPRVFESLVADVRSSPHLVAPDQYIGVVLTKCAIGRRCIFFGCVDECSWKF